MADQKPEQPLFKVPVINPFTNPTVPEARKPIAQIQNFTPGDPPSTLETVIPSSTPEPESPEAAACLRLQARLKLPPHPYPTQPLTPVKPPIRLIVSTKTHLVPGEDHNARVLFLLNLLARYHFGTGYQVGKHRYYTHSTLFGYAGVQCWVCLDYGTVESTRRDCRVKVVAYSWAGKQLIPDPILPHDKYAKSLLRNLYPFTRPRNPALLTPSGKPKKPETAFLSKNPEKPVPVYINVRNKLRYRRRITNEELDYMRGHLQEVDWLREGGGLEDEMVRRLEKMMQVRWRQLKREKVEMEEEEEKWKKEDRRRRMRGWGVKVWKVLTGWIRKEKKEDEDGVKMMSMAERGEVREVQGPEVEVERSKVYEVKEREVESERSAMNEVKRQEVEMEKRRMKEKREREKKEKREREDRMMQELWVAWQQQKIEEEKREKEKRALKRKEEIVDQLDVSWAVA